MFYSITSLIYAFSTGDDKERVLTKRRVGLLLAVLSFATLAAGLILRFY